MKDTLIHTSETIKHRISNIIAVALSKGYSLALWRLPHQSVYKLLLSESKGVEQKPDFDSRGFTFGKFNNEGLKNTFFLKDDCMITFDLENNEFASSGIEGFTEEIANNYSWHYSQPDNLESTAKDAYINNVSKGIEAIGQGEFRKVVVAKRLVEGFSNGDQLLDYYITYADKYPNALNSLVSIKDTGTWLTATPEILVSVNQDNVFKTVALAGTQKRTVENLKEALWSQKEIEEQSFVSKYIINCFKKIRVREYDDIGPKTVPAGELLHLRTDFYVNQNDVEYPHLAETMMGLLHPTSAVCGMPKAASKEFILDNENFDRSYFSGFLGPVNIDGETHQYVNLRSAQIIKDKIIYYAGAGITEDSNPQKEWEETELKINTLRSVFAQKP